MSQTELSSDAIVSILFALAAHMSEDDIETVVHISNADEMRQFITERDLMTDSISELMS